MLATMALCSVAGVFAADGIVNGGFEVPVGRDEPVPGWVLELGAQNGAKTPESTVEVDREQRHSGEASLRFSGERATRGWRIAKQAVEVRPGGRYELTAWTRAAGVEPNGFGIDNGYVGLFFFDSAGAVAGRAFANVRRPDSDWSEQEITLVAPPNAREAQVFLFLSMLGDLWVDDVALSIEGGEPLAEEQPLELVHREDFTSSTRVPSKWKTEEGARNGRGSRESTIAVDKETGAPDSPRSLVFSGDAETRRWRSLYREWKAEPGQLWRLRALVKAEDVRREGEQFQNLHVNLSFFDRRGKPLGAARFGNADPGTHDWSDVAVDAVSPEGTAEVKAGLFLSMSGRAWFDDVELWRRDGVPIPYGGWETIDRGEIVLRHAADHPQARGMREYAVRLEQARAEILRRLELEFEDPITVFVYRDLDEGRALTGGSLDFADPEHRRVHQRLESFIGHELVHVIAHTQLGYSGTGILGEGIAVWLNGQSAARHHARAAQLRAEGKLPSVRDLLGRFRELDAGYPAASSFCGYLMDEHGLDVFKEIYPLDDPSKGLKERKGVSFEDLEPGWHALLERSR